LAGGWLDAAVRVAGARITAALAARFRDLDIAEDAFAEACARGAALPHAPENPAGWLWRVAERVALDRLRAAKRTLPEPLEAAAADTNLIPDERLRLFLVACHPALAPESRAALILRLIVGLPVERIARAFLSAEPAMLQRLTRAKRKIADSGVPFDIPAPGQWRERVDGVLIALDVVHAQASADALATPETRALIDAALDLSGMVAAMLPNDADAAAQAAAFRLAEARRPARVVAETFVPLAEQNPALWDQRLIAAAVPYLRRAVALSPSSPRVMQARIQAVWCGRRSLVHPAPWGTVLALYDELLTVRDDAIVRINRAVALAEVAGPEVAFAELGELDAKQLGDFAPWHAVRADLLRRLGRSNDARTAYDVAILLTEGRAEQAFLSRRRMSVPDDHFAAAAR
jgi:RNA polymerase sigma-70 factor, ECF subfamily